MTVTPSPKPHLSWEAQLDRLESRGLVVEDRKVAIRTLQNENYYRLRGYFVPFLQAANLGERPNFFMTGTSFSQILNLMKFDQKLRTLVFEASTQFELRLRSAVAYFGGAHDPHFHLNGNGLHESFTATRVNNQSMHSSWLEDYEAKVGEHHTEDFVAWHLTTYAGKLPIWAAAEIMDFGSLSTLLRGMSQSLSAQVSDFFECGSSTFKNWVGALNELRNHAAHQTRLWNRYFPRTLRARERQLPPNLRHLSSLDKSSLHKLYPRLAILAQFDRGDRLDINFKARLLETLESLPASPFTALQQMGFPEGWKEQSLWAT